LSAFRNTSIDVAGSLDGTLGIPNVFFEPGQKVWMQLGQIRRYFRSMDSSFSWLIHRGVPLRQSGTWLVGTPIISFDDFPTGLPNSPILYGWLCIPLYPGWWFGRFLIFPNSWDDWDDWDDDPI